MRKIIILGTPKRTVFTYNSKVKNPNTYLEKNGKLLTPVFSRINSIINDMFATNETTDAQLQTLQTRGTSPYPKPVPKDPILNRGIFRRIEFATMKQRQLKE